MASGFHNIDSTQRAVSILYVLVVSSVKTIAFGFEHTAKQEKNKGRAHAEHLQKNRWSLVRACFHFLPCMLPFLAIWFLYVGLTRSWFRLLGSCNMLFTMGHWFASVSISCLGLTGTWFRFQSVVDHWSLVLVFPRQTTWGGPFSRNVCFGFMTGKPPPEKICWRFGQGEGPRPRGHSRSYGFQFGH